jgi:hypothetical protein
MAQITFDEITFNGGGNELMDPMITKVVDQVNLAREGREVKAQLGFVDTRPLSSNETYSSVNGVNELPSLNENGTKEEMELSVGPAKGYKIQEFGGKITSSFLFGEWLKTSKTLNGAKDDLKAEFVSQAQKTKKLMKAAEKGMAYEAIKVLTKGASISAAYGPGSATPKGKALFAANHTVYATGGTFSNIGSGAFTDATAAAAAIKDAIGKHLAIRLENGDRVQQPRAEGYTLFVSPAKEMIAREALNNGSKFAATGSNASAENVFMFEGSKVKLEVIDKLGDTDRDGVAIGADTNWFLVNMPALKEAEALKCIRLYSPIVKQYMNNETDQSIVDIRNGFTCDHYGAEYFIVGYTS